MWFRSGGGGVAGVGSICGQLVRHFSRKRAENLRKINPKVSPQEATTIAHQLYDLIKQHGPLTISNAWTHAKDSNVSGLNSKTHMKLLLKWMRGRKMLKLLCNQVGSNKKFLLSVPEESETTVVKTSSYSRAPSKKSSVKTKH